MECTLATLVACFSWSGFYVDSGLSWQDTGMPRTDYQAVVYRRDDGFQYEIYDETVVYDRKNPYGSIGLGYEIEFHRLRISLDIAHQSSLATGRDDGRNYARLGFRWFPFR